MMTYVLDAYAALGGFAGACVVIPATLVVAFVVARASDRRARDTRDERVTLDAFFAGPSA